MSKDFRDGLEVELEHGLAFSDANVTNNHPILTGHAGKFLVRAQACFSFA